jgi:hypothetical protein
MLPIPRMNVAGIPQTRTLSLQSRKTRIHRVERFVLNPPPAIGGIDQRITIKVGWQDNPRFPEVLDRERQYLQSIDPEAYVHVWEGSRNEPLRKRLLRNPKV